MYIFIAFVFPGEPQANCNEKWTKRRHSLYQVLKEVTQHDSDGSYIQRHTRKHQGHCVNISGLRFKQLIFIVTAYDKK